MGTIRINGTLKPIRRPVEYNFDPVRGLTITEEWESAGDNLAGIAANYYTRGVAYRWKRGKARSSLIATISGGQNGAQDTPQQNWQLLTNEIQKSIFESPFALNVEAAFPGLLRLVKLAAAYIDNGETQTEKDLEDTLSDEEFAVFDKLLTLLLRGATHVAFGQPVLKHTFSVSNFYDGVLPDLGLSEVIISLAQIGVGNPLTLRLAQQITAGTAHPDYAWGWRRLPANASTSADNRVEISREWWWGEWSTVLYPDER